MSKVNDWQTLNCDMKTLKSFQKKPRLKNACYRAKYRKVEWLAFY